MKKESDTAITIEAMINAPVEKVWKCWSEPKHILKWYFASTDWHAPEAENDLRVGGKFKTKMAAKDGSFSFDFGGEYTEVDEYIKIDYTLEDNRKVKILFEENGLTTRVIETFDPENENPLELQKGGWQAILNNFKLYVESKGLEV